MMFCEKEILTVIQSSSKESCFVDPIPTQFLAEHFLQEMVPVITDGVLNLDRREFRRKEEEEEDMFLSMRIFPSFMKTALIRPFLKKSSLNPDILKNFRPVSSLSFLSDG